MHGPRSKAGDDEDPSLDFVSFQPCFCRPEEVNAYGLEWRVTADAFLWQRRHDWKGKLVRLHAATSAAVLERLLDGDSGMRSPELTQELNECAVDAEMMSLLMGFDDEQLADGRVFAENDGMGEAVCLIAFSLDASSGGVFHFPRRLMGELNASHQRRPSGPGV